MHRMITGMFAPGLVRALFIAVSILAIGVVIWNSQSVVSSASVETQQSQKKVADHFDIRTEKDDKAVELFERKRAKLSAKQLNSAKNAEKAAEAATRRLQRSKPGSDVKIGKDIGAAEVVTAGLNGKKLTGRSGAKRSDILRGFLNANSDLYGLTQAEVAELAVVSDYTNPAGNLSWSEFEQRIDGIPVFQGTLLGAMTPEGELIRTTGRLVPGIDSRSAGKESASLLDAKGQGSVDSVTQAIASAANSVGVELDPSQLAIKEESDNGRTFLFDRGQLADDVSAELVYFPLEAGNVTLAWSMTIWLDGPSYYAIVDAETGTLLWRKNITDEQTQSATYSVYDGDSPAPMSPFVGTPGTNVQAPAVPRTTYTLISEHPANQLGWLTDGATTTTGNNVDAGLDIASPNGIDPSGRPVSPTRTFVYDFNPSPGIVGLAGSASVTDTNYRWGAVTNLFFQTNRYHDRLYDLGFTEAARNFQQDNFGRNPGGLTANARNGVDRVLAEAQDFSGTNNANFSTPADGGSGRMQMYVWPLSNRDGDFDNEIVIHELTHGTSNRLHNNASGLNTKIARGMGEGWSDFYARALLATADEDVDGIYAMGGYATHLAATGYTNNYYSGIRRFPYAVMSNVGPNGLPHNPVTFADTNPNLIDLNDGAYPRGPFGAGGRSGANAVHNMGEIWCMALFEGRARLIKRLGFEEGNRRMLQIVTDAMKIDPVGPTMIDSRNSVLLVASTYSQDDVRDIWKGFAIRGMGFGATMATDNANGKESFDNPIPGVGAVTVSDCNGNGYSEPGELITLTIPLTNPLGTDVNDVSVQVQGGGSANYGTIAPGQTVTKSVSVVVPDDVDCGSEFTISFVVTSDLGSEVKTHKVRIGAPVVTSYENFDGVTAPVLPAGWTTSASGTGTVWRTTTVASDSGPNSVFTTFGSNTGRADLIFPTMAVPAAGTTQIIFRHSYNSEFEWDGGSLFIAIDGITPSGSVTEFLSAGGSFQEGGYNFSLLTTNDGNTNPIQNFPAWTGNSNGFITTIATLPASAAGRNVTLRFIAGADSSTTVANSHWRVDSIGLINSYSCSTGNPTSTTASAAAAQYSDPVMLKATVSGSTCSNVVGSMEFRVDGVLVGSTPVDGDGEYSVPYTVTNGPGNHTIEATFVSTRAFHGNSSGTNTLTVSQENAEVAFPDSNPFSVKVNSAGGTAGPIQICADITEVADGSLGDITKATASFTFDPVAGGQAPVPGAVTYSQVGSAQRACTTVNNVRVDVYDVTVNVGGYYTGSNSTVLAIYDPSLGFVTGGGTVVNNGFVANFGINLKYLKNGKPQGSVLYMEHRPGGPIKIKSSALDSLSIVNNTAILLSKAVVNGVGNHAIRMTMIDNGDSGAGDQFGLQVNAPGGALVSEFTFAPKVLRGGNIQVPQNASKK